MADARAYEAFYAEVSADAPAGAAREAEDFADLDEVVEWPRDDFGRPDSQQTPDFGRILDLSRALLEKPATRDVRPLAALILGEAGRNGPKGFADALDLFAHWWETHWQAVHPQDLEEDGEFFDRMDVLRPLMQERPLSLALEAGPVAVLPRLGKTALRALLLAGGAARPREGEFALDADSARQLISQEPEAVAAVEQAAADLRRAVEALARISGQLEAHPEVFEADAFRSDVLGKLSTFCEGAIKALEACASSEEPAEADEAPPIGAADAPLQAGHGAAPPALAAGLSVASREEAVAAMEAIVRYYARNARSSPVPLAVIAIHDLLDADFNRWIKETAPKGLEQVALELEDVKEGRLDDFLDPEDPPAAEPPDLRPIAAALDDLEAELAPLREAEAWGEAMQEKLDALREAIDRFGEEEEDSAAPKGPSIETRPAVKDALEKIAVFFDQHEPSNPSPAYLRRLKALVDAKFPEIARSLINSRGDVRLTLDLS